ncbi:MAG: AEC family transporter, partial [Anaerolineaceae bacterium]|nr:AEC family transporter [Anaerolineaceae bacterium]
MISTFTSVFFIFGLGFVIQKIRPMEEKVLTQFSELFVDILIPIFLFYVTATGTSIEALRSAPALVAAGVLIPVVTFLLIRPIVMRMNLPEGQQSVLLVAIMMPNSGFLGIPICDALFGTTGAVYAVLYDFSSNLVLLTLCVWLFSGGRIENWRSLVLNPLIWSIAGGTIWSLFDLSFPLWLDKPLSMISATALPMVLLVTGAQIGNIKTRAIIWWRQLSTLTSVRLVIIPLLVAAALAAFFGSENLVIKVIILESAMPVAIFTGILASAVPYSWSITDARSCGPVAGTQTVTEPAALTVGTSQTNVTC